MTTRIYVIQRAVPAIGISVKRLGVERCWYNTIRTQEPPNNRIIKPSVIVIQAGGAIAFLVGIELDRLFKIPESCF
jgi:hypothetical protein